MDTVDDLHAAEDLAGMLADVAREMSAALAVIDRTVPRRELEALTPARVRLEVAVAEWETFCRPTCGADGVEGACLEGDCCGCPCHDRGA